MGSGHVSGGVPAGAASRDVAAKLHRVFGEVCPPDDPWSLLDYPMHYNCGDAALFLGAQALARHHGSVISQVLDRDSYRPTAVTPGTAIVYQAGGNWGGLYETHHALRLQVLADLKGRPFLQLPQSIEYASDRHREELRRAVAEHGQVTLLVRDRRSFDIATEDYDCTVRLVPDAAFALGRRDRALPTMPRSVQARVDKEGSDTSAVDPGWGPVWDWLDVDRSSVSARRFRWARDANRLQRRLPCRLTHGVAVHAATALAESSLARARALLSQGSTVVTDRLHGHILSTIHGIPHVVVNDKFGKIAAFRDTWTHDDPLHTFAATWGDVGEAVSLLDARRTARP